MHIKLFTTRSMREREQCSQNQGWSKSYKEEIIKYYDSITEL